MNIIMASDDRFVPQLAVTLLSLYQQHTEVSELDVAVIDGGITREHHVQLQSIAAKFTRTILFLKPPVVDQNISVTEGLSISTYYRLFLTELLPQWDKVLYLDCDLLIANSLLPLWQMTLQQNCWLAGVADTVSRNAKTKVGLSGDDLYVNCGVLLIDLDKWRKEALTDRFLKFLYQHHGAVAYNDQGIINGVCKGHIQELAVCYNMMPDYFRFSVWQLEKIMQCRCEIDAKQLSEARENPVIIHFAGNRYNRPWVKDCTHPWTASFLRTAAETGIELDLQPSKRNDHFRRVCDKLPFFLYLAMRLFWQKHRA